MCSSSSGSTTTDDNNDDNDDGSMTQRSRFASCQQCVQQKKSVNFDFKIGCLTQHKTKSLAKHVSYSLSLKEDCINPFAAEAQNTHFFMSEMMDLV